MAKATTGYTVIDMTTNRTLGVWHSVSERGAKSQAVKSTGIPYRYLTAVPFVQPTPVEPAPRDLSLFAMSFPALNGEWVLQGHADYCAANGHATHKVDGVIASFCPRCGDRVAPESAPESAPVYTFQWENGVSGSEYTVASMAEGFAHIDRALRDAEFPSSLRLSILKDGVGVWSQQGTHILLNAGTVAPTPTLGEQTVATPESAPDQWVSVVFMDGDDYDSAMDAINDMGGSTGAAVEYLSQWDYGTENDHSPTETVPWGAYDTTHIVTHGGIKYVYATNHIMGYVSLNRRPMGESAPESAPRIVTGRTVTVDTLSEFMQFDRVIRVSNDLSVHNTAEHYAPDLYDGELQDPAWTLMTGWTGQYGYDGPIMHASEYIGGHMASAILANPGYYVALVSNNGECPECADVTEEDYICDYEHIDGWAVAYRPLEDTKGL